MGYLRIFLLFLKDLILSIVLVVVTSSMFFVILFWFPQKEEALDLIRVYWGLLLSFSSVWVTLVYTNWRGRLLVDLISVPVFYWVFCFGWGSEYIYTDLPILDTFGMSQFRFLQEEFSRKVGFVICELTVLVCQLSLTITLWRDLKKHESGSARHTEIWEGHQSFIIAHRAISLAMALAFLTEGGTQTFFCIIVGFFYIYISFFTKDP